LTIADAPGATNFTIYIPDFLQEYSLSEKSIEEQKIELLRKDWLTSGLTHEIETLFPTHTEIQINDDDKCDPIDFQHKIAQLFPFGLIFVSFKQIGQAADMFLGAWAISRRPATPKASSVHTGILQPMIGKIESIQTYPKDASLN
jgi:hypothetical protein